MLWAKNLSMYQKIVLMIFFVAFLGPFSLIFTGNFVPTTSHNRLALYFSLALTSILSIFIFYLYKNRLWISRLDWNRYSKLKKNIAVFASFATVVGIFWIDLAISLPHLYTEIFGKRALTIDTVTKENHYSRRSCEYRIQPRSIDFALFKFCISDTTYDRLPDENLRAKLILKQSRFGYAVEDIRVIN